MSVSSITSSLNTLRRELNRIQDKQTDAANKYAKQDDIISRSNDRLSRTTSASRISSYNRDINRAQAEKAKLSKVQASLSKDFGKKQRQIADKEKDLRKATADEQQKQLRSMQKDYSSQIVTMKREQSELLKSQFLSDDASGTRDSKEYDVFISYAHEDQEYAEKLTSAIQAMDLSVWIDEQSMGWGASQIQSMDDGIRNSKFSIVLLSPDYFDKYWTTHEYHSMLIKAKNQHDLILPIYHNVTADQVKDYNLELADRHALNTSISTVEEIAHKLHELIASTSSTDSENS
ncbi:TIR domain-containing protein [Lacticaseibacillus paracasei]|jgi:hypothetical protein|uniref:TIR domain-containing protein n=1 Tax=Lacticaseibacillus paracasei TaxID=1597 RepID=UPI0040402B3F